MTEEFGLQEKLSYLKLIPDDWFTKGEIGSVLIHGYRILNSDKSDFSPPRIMFESKDIIACICYGKFVYPTMDVEFEGAWYGETKIATKFDFHLTLSGPHLILMTPFFKGKIDLKKNDYPPDALIKGERLSAIAGLIASINGRNCVFKRDIDFVLEVKTNNWMGSSREIHSPSRYDVPKFDSDRKKTIQTALDKLGILQSESLQRVLLSLHWYEMSLRTFAVDSFLQKWVALEVLAMEGTNIKQVKELLDIIYGSSEPELNSLFGRLASVRAEIVHNGTRILENAVISDFLEAIYIDVLFYFLQIPSLRKIEDFFSVSKVKLKASLL